MRYFTILMLTILSVYSAISQCSISVHLIDSESGESIPFAAIYLYNGTSLIDKGVTDLEGNITFAKIPFSNYLLKTNYTGYKDAHLNIAILEEKTYEITLKIREDLILDEVVIKGYRTPHADMAISTSSATLTSASIAPSRKYTKTSTKTTLPSSGQVTAGEWNDLHNWKDWESLLKNEEYSIMTSRWGISPTNRYSLLVINNLDIPVVNAKASLLDKNGNLIWQTYTDNTGKAELWSNTFDEGEAGQMIKVEFNGRSKTLDDIRLIKDGGNTIKLRNECCEEHLVDVVFTVDATGSMGDEIAYLKSELLDVIERVKSKNDKIDMKMGSVFYRDVSDSYLTKQSPLSSDMSTTLEFINGQSADGGGDFPEAVHTALEESLNLEWRNEALKLNFLILDAPPHENDKTLSSLKEQIRLAAAKGVRLIPITASGINRETEFLMKFMAILTNGTYVFITDDSGIGNPHLTPVITDYEVEKLNDLMVRIISEYIEIRPCDVPFKEKNLNEVSIFPNPCTNYVNVKTSMVSDKITITSNSGMIVKTIVPTKKETKIDLDDLVNGVYTLTCFNGNSIESRQLLVVR